MSSDEKKLKILQYISLLFFDGREQDCSLALLICHRGRFIFFFVENQLGNRYSKLEKTREKIDLIKEGDTLRTKWP